MYLFELPGEISGIGIAALKRDFLDVAIRLLQKPPGVGHAVILQEQEDADLFFPQENRAQIAFADADGTGDQFGIERAVEIGFDQFDRPGHDPVAGAELLIAFELRDMAHQ